MTSTSTRVLIVDDDPANAVFVADIAADAGYEPTTAGSAAAALEVLDTGEFELLVTDIRMSGMDGIQLIERLRGQNDRIAIIAITAFGSLQTGLRALKAGASDYLPKPFDPNELREKMDRALEARSRRLENDRLRKENERLRRELEEVLSRKKGP